MSARSNSGWYWTPQKVPPAWVMDAAWTLQKPVRRQDHASRRQMRHLVQVDGRLVEDRRLALEHGMAPAGFRQRHLAGDPHLAAPRARLYPPAGRRRRHLQAPATAEEGPFGGEHGAGEVDLAPHPRIVFTTGNVEPGAADQNTVIGGQFRAAGQGRIRIRRTDHVDGAVRLQGLQHVDEAAAARPAAQLFQHLVAVPGVALGDQEAKRPGH